MRNFFSVLLFLVAYCTPLVLITVPIGAIVGVVRSFKTKKYRITDSCKNEPTYAQRNTHFGVDL